MDLKPREPYQCPIKSWLEKIKEENAEIKKHTQQAHITLDRFRKVTEGNDEQIKGKKDQGSAHVPFQPVSHRLVTILLRIEFRHLRIPDPSSSIIFLLCLIALSLIRGFHM